MEGVSLSHGRPEEAADARSDVELVAALAGGEPGAMEELVHRHQGRLWRLAYRLSGDAEAANDLVQETFVRLYQAAARYKPAAELSTFLHRILVNLNIDAHRNRRPMMQLAHVEAAASAATPAESLEVKERQQRVRAAVAALPQRQRVAVILHRYDSLSYREIAQVLETTEAAVESLIMRGYAQLRSALADLR